MSDNWFLPAMRRADVQEAELRQRNFRHRDEFGNTVGTLTGSYIRWNDTYITPPEFDQAEWDALHEQLILPDRPSVRITRRK